MTTRKLKVYSTARISDNSVDMRLLIGKDGELEEAGELNMSLGDWQIFAAALVIGASLTNNELVVEMLGQGQVVRHAVEAGVLS